MGKMHCLNVCWIESNFELSTWICIWTNRSR